jgi:hypothetical protein
VGPFLERRAIERQNYTCREQFVSRADKAVRAKSMRGRISMLGLYVQLGAPWFADLRAELLSFPAGRHDDQVNALGLVGQLLDKISAKSRLKPPEVLHRWLPCASRRWVVRQLEDHVRGQSPRPKSLLHSVDRQVQCHHSHPDRRATLAAAPIERAAFC